MSKALLGFLLILVCLQAKAQTLTMSKVPPAAAHAFRAKYQAAQQESWEQIDTNKYQVAFFNAKKRQIARFDRDGKWIETETEVNFSQVPRAISNAVSKQFANYEVQQVAQIESPDGTMTYEVVVFNAKGNYDVIFSAKGDVLKKEAGKVEGE